MLSVMTQGTRLYSFYDATLMLCQGKREFNCLGLEIKYIASTHNSLASTSHMVQNKCKRG